jgi:glucose/arabinose dehydrogenase
VLKKFGLIIIAGFVCALLSALPATAQQESQQQQQGQGGAIQPQVEVADAELNKAAAAYVQIAKIQKEFQESLQTAPDPDQKQELQQKANKKMIQAVEKEGMDVTTYSQVIAAVKSDDNLREKFMERLQEMQN